MVSFLIELKNLVTLENELDSMEHHDHHFFFLKILFTYF